MRLWHYRLLPYLSDLQFRGQLRELVAIMHDWRDKGTTNHLLINRVMEYDKEELVKYAFEYFNLYEKRYNKDLTKYKNEFLEFAPSFELGVLYNPCLYIGWHEKDYLRVCMSNLYEKYALGLGKSRISAEEWGKLLQGYKNITGEEYKL